MKSTTLFSLASLVLSASAYGVVGTYERMWFWYAYELDTQGKEIAPTCGRQMGAGAGVKCSFTQFMEWLNEGTGTSINPSALNGVDPDDLPSATAALKNGEFTGVYDCTHVWEGLPGVENQTPAKDNVAELFRRVGQLCQNRLLQGGTDAQKTKLQAVTQAVMRGRQGNAVAPYTTSMSQRSPPITLVAGTVPIYDGAPAGDDYIVPSVDSRGTLAANPGLKVSQFKAACVDIADADGVGHTNNAKAAAEAHAAVNIGCLV